ncbi:MAG: TetR/AcrR family transcriptional regulator [Ruminococcus sp.]|nr:TetR/AcrR family transcriptional regulator [Ruminococcus sp.]
MAELAKKALANALKEMIKEKDLDSITVKDLTDKCGLKRQTFYYHFKNIYDLIKWLYTNELIIEIDSSDNWLKSFEEIFKFVSQNKKLILATYNSIAKEYFLNLLYSDTNKFINKIIEEKLNTRPYSDDQKIFLSNFYKNALIGCVRDWIETDMEEDYHNIIVKVEAIIEGSIDLFFSNIKKKKGEQ